MLDLPPRSIGVGDRFGRQAPAQLRALMQAAEAGIALAPVWNKSHREHKTIGSQPASVLQNARSAVESLGYEGPWFVDADHIGLATVDAFLESSNFFTLDVADAIGGEVDPQQVEDFVSRHESLIGEVSVPGLEAPLQVDRAGAEAAARKFLPGVLEAGRIYRHIAEAKGAENFVTEVSMDETDSPQTPLELLFILAAVADEGIPAQTIAPKFTGRFNKGVDYVGDVAQFTSEFEQDLCVLAYAVREFGLPGNLKLSVHSGSDKFSIYGPIRRALEAHDAGLHLKTAGTSWLEELIGLALAGGEGLELAREVYARSLDRYEELCAPYATVIDINPSRLPEAGAVAGWSGEAFAEALRHDPGCPRYNPHFRQLLHVGYKVAAQMGERYLDALDAAGESVAQCVGENLLERHIRPLFL